MTESGTLNTPEFLKLWLLKMSMSWSTNQDCTRSAGQAGAADKYQHLLLYQTSHLHILVSKFHMAVGLVVLGELSAILLGLWPDLKLYSWH